jgi:hypothetical protein
MKETIFISTTIGPETYSTVYGFQQLSAAGVHVSAARRVYLCLAVQETDAPREPGLSHGESPPPGYIFSHGITSLMALFIYPLIRAVCSLCWFTLGASMITVTEGSPMCGCLVDHYSSPLSDVLKSPSPLYLEPS